MQDIKKDVSLRIHFTEMTISKNDIDIIIKKLMGKDNIFKINYKICYTKNSNKEYKTFYIHFKKIIINNENENIYNKLLAGEIINILYSYPNYWRCSMINNKIDIPTPKNIL